MQDDHKSDEVLLAQEMKRIITTIHQAGPRDVYQLAEPDRDPQDVERLVKVLVDQNLLVERIDYPSTPDPLTKVYSVPTVVKKASATDKTTPIKPLNKLPSW